MKTFCFCSSMVFCLVFVACGPAAENREMMHNRANVIADSIANDIKQKMGEASVPGPAGNIIKVDTPSTKQNTVAPK